MNQSDDLRWETHYVSPSQAQRLFVQRVCRDSSGTALLLIHGAIEDGRIFYTRSGKGLAPYLARQGYDVYVADLRGHGHSEPPIDAKADYGQREVICEDIPALLRYITALRGDITLHCLAHSWGGVLVSAALARQPVLMRHVRSLVYFGSKRQILVHGVRRWLWIDLIWNGLCRALVALYGYLPARAWRLGSDNESAGFYTQSAIWVSASPWVDPIDGFDYGTALQDQELPPTLYFAAVNDHTLGHPEDVQRLMHESGNHKASYVLLGRRSNNLHDYGHISMLTHADATQDHFPSVVQWLRSHEADD